MKNIQLALIISSVILVSFKAKAQKEPFKYGKVDEKEWSYTHYSLDSNAAAVILGDFGHTTFSYNNDRDAFKLNFERRVRIKILKKEGYKYADVSIPLYTDGQSKEKIIGLKGITHNLVNGKVEETKMKNNAVFEEQYSDNIDYVKFTLPNVTEGSVIEYSYTVVSDFIFNLQDWAFQAEIPTVISEYRTRVPEFYQYQQYMQGYEALTKVESKDIKETFLIQYTTQIKNNSVPERGQYNLPSNSVETRYVMENAPAFYPEGYIHNPENYLSKINFELATVSFPNQPIKPIMGTWESINATFWDSESFGKVVIGTNFLKKDTEQLIEDAATDEEKIGRVYGYVKSKFEWDGRYRKYVTDGARKAWDEGKGASSDINLILTSMLRKAGINAYPMLISTRKNGAIIQQFPVSSQFNSVITYVDLGDKYLLLDATQKDLILGMLPENCVNGKGLVITETRPHWREIVSLPSSSKSSVILALNEEGILSGKISASKTGYQALNSRRNAAKDKEEYSKALDAYWEGEVSNVAFENLENPAEPLKESFDISIETENLGDVIYLNPIFTNRLEKNPFRLEERKYPVEFGSATDEMLYIVIDIPDSYVVDDLPKTTVISLPDGTGKFSYKVNQMGNKITLIHQLVISKPVFTYDEYAALKQFYSLIVAKHAEQIVLKKKS